MKIPDAEKTIDLKFVDFRDRLPEAIIETSPKGNILHVSFAESQLKEICKLTEELLVEIGEDSTLAGFWILNINEDRAAKSLAEWRREIKNADD